MSQVMFPGDVYVAGNLSVGTLLAPKSSISDVNVTASAGNYVQANKIQQQWNRIYNGNGPTTSTPVADQRTIHVVHGATATLLDFKAGMAGSLLTGNATITVDLWKNGSSILSTTINLSSTTPAAVRTYVQAAGFTSASAVIGDWFEVKVTVNAGTGSLGTGLVAALTIREDPV